MTLDRIQPGDVLSAAQENLLIEQVNVLSRPGSAAQAQYGSAGVSFLDARETHLALFELTDACVYPNLATASTGHLNCEPTPYAPAKMVWRHTFREADQTTGGQAVRSYATADSSTAKTIWFPLNRRNSDGYGVGPPVVRSGSRVLCLFNAQSARWEVVQGPPYFLACMGRLDNQLDAGSSATVSLWWGGSDSGVDVTAYDWFLKPNTHLDSNIKVKVEFFPHDDRWWVTAAECG